MIASAFASAARLFDPETAHRMTISALSCLPFSPLRGCDSRLRIKVAGLDFAHPLGLAPGFDKDARAAHAMARFGFAAVEVGTLTPLAQAGNPLPRLFRLSEDRAVINRMGFNNGGQAAALPRIAALHRRSERPLVGVNIGANKDSADRIADYRVGVERMAGVADWLTVNISSPNTPGLRDLQEESALADLLAAVAEERERQRAAGFHPPVFLKVAPDVAGTQIDSIVRVAVDKGIDALIVGNTTISRPPLQSRHAGETGGLSGAPLAPLALARLRDFRAATGGQIPLVAAGGIASAEDAWQRLRAGASLIQIYSAMVYEGPGLAARIVKGLAERLDSGGHGHIAEIVGADVGLQR